MAIDFEGLRRQLILNLRERVRTGEITERRLARVTGVSQPHLHNVLSGKRLLSIEMADQILRHLHLELLDLLDPDQRVRRH
jgi:transcriptional regulator with XRE-family HTH domain